MLVQHGSAFYLDESLPYLMIFIPLAWHDLAFYNSDLYEGLRQMMLDAEQGKKDNDEFMATYCEVRERYS